MKLHILCKRLIFVLFNDTWPQHGHSVSCLIIQFSLLANYQIRHQATCKFDLAYDCK